MKKRYLDIKDYCFIEAFRQFNLERILKEEIGFQEKIVLPRAIFYDLISYFSNGLSSDCKIFLGSEYSEKEMFDFLSLFDGVKEFTMIYEFDYDEFSIYIGSISRFLKGDFKQFMFSISRDNFIYYLRNFEHVRDNVLVINKNDSLTFNRDYSRNFYYTDHHKEEVYCFTNNFIGSDVTNPLFYFKVDLFSKIRFFRETLNNMKYFQKLDI